MMDRFPNPQAQPCYQALYGDFEHKIMLKMPRNMPKRIYLPAIHEIIKKVTKISHKKQFWNFLGEIEPEFVNGIVYEIDGDGQWKEIFKNSFK